MSKEVRISAIERKDKDQYLRLYVLALIEAARHFQAEERTAQAPHDERREVAS